MRNQLIVVKLIILTMQQKMKSKIGLSISFLLFQNSSTISRFMKINRNFIMIMNTIVMTIIFIKCSKCLKTTKISNRLKIRSVIKFYSSYRIFEKTSKMCEKSLFETSIMILMFLIEITSKLYFINISKILNY